MRNSDPRGLQQGPQQRETSKTRRDSGNLYQWVTHRNIAITPTTPLGNLAGLIVENCCRQASLKMSTVLSTFRAHYGTPSERSAISLSLRMCLSNQGSVAIEVQARTRSDPCISSFTTSIMRLLRTPPSGKPFCSQGAALGSWLFTIS